MGWACVQEGGDQEFTQNCGGKTYLERSLGEKRRCMGLRKMGQVELTQDCVQQRALLKLLVVLSERQLCTDQIDSTVGSPSSILVRAFTIFPVLERIRELLLEACYKILSRRSFGKTEEDHETPQSGQSVTLPKLNRYPLPLEQPYPTSHGKIRRS